MNRKSYLKMSHFRYETTLNCASPTEIEEQDGRVMRRALRWALIAALGTLVLSMSTDARRFNPAQREGAPYLYNITMWEVNNALSKWVFRARNALNGDGEAAREQDARDYFAINTEMAQVRGRLRFAAARSLHEETAKMQALLDDTEAQAAALSGGAEETIESYISAVIVAEGLGLFGEVVFPPVDVRLTQPPKLLIVSPRERIDRRHDALLRPDINLSERESVEHRILRDDNLSALVEDIGGLATYPASVANGHPMRWTVQASAHEWLHHYFFFKPLGRHMFDNDDMFQLNETIANVAGKEIGSRAYDAMAEDSLIQEQIHSRAAPPGADTPPPFDFAAEMRKTRLTVDEMLAEGQVEEAEAYMVERRHAFVENGYPIRKLNQAYFAFYGTYADLPAAVSPIGDQVKRFRELVPDLGDFITEVSEISSYDKFLRRLDELEEAN